MNDKGIRPCGCWLWFFEDEAGGAEREVRAQLWFSQTWHRLVRKLEGGLVQIAEDMEQCVLVSNREDMSFCFHFLCVPSRSGKSPRSLSGKKSKLNVHWITMLCMIILISDDNDEESDDSPHDVCDHLLARDITVCFQKSRCDYL